MRRVGLLVAIGLAPLGCGDDGGTVAPTPTPAVAPVDAADDDGEKLRAASVATLAKAGFTAPARLPTRARRAGLPGKLRPLHELAGRAMALKAVHAWSTKTAAEIPSDVLTDYIKRSSLQRYMNQTELDIVAMERGAAAIAQRDNAPWRLENLWALCWVLGLEHEPPLIGGTIPEDIVTAMLGDFLPGYGATLKEFAPAVKPRRSVEVAALEDVFYCAHAAARDAGSGKAGVAPPRFDPALDGGVIHERRHALSWALSPGVPWDQTDLTT